MIRCVHTYRSPLLAFRGATELPDAATSPFDAAGVPWHYGDPLREQRLISRGGVVVDRSHRGVLRVTGPDAATFLNNLLSQKLDDVEPGFSAAALDLDMQGRILHHADVSLIDAAPTFYLDLPSYSLDSFRDFLTKMVFWSEVTVEEADLGILTVLGAPSSFSPAEFLSGAGITAAFERTVPWSAARRIDVAVPRPDLAAAYKALTSPVEGPAGDSAGSSGAGTSACLDRAGLMAFTAERIKALEPELRVDLDNKSIPHEAHTLIRRGENLGAVHLDKGCYRGQETVARVENLGRSPRLLVLLHIDGSAPLDPKPGDPVTFGGRTVGHVGSIVHDCDYGPIALALVKRSALTQAIDTGAQLDVIASVRAESADGDNEVVQEINVSATVDPDSMPKDEGERAGRVAVDKLRGCTN